MGYGLYIERFSGHGLFSRHSSAGWLKSFLIHCCDSVIVIVNLTCGGHPYTLDVSGCFEYIIIPSAIIFYFSFSWYFGLDILDFELQLYFLLVLRLTFVFYCPSELDSVGGGFPGYAIIVTNVFFDWILRCFLRIYLLHYTVDICWWKSSWW